MYEVFLLDIGYLKNEETFAANYERMSEERKNKITVCKRERDRRLSLGVGILLDDWLRARGLSIQMVVMDVVGKGKSVFRDYPEWHFNLSHSGDYAALVVADKPVGIDIEKIGKPNLKVMRIAFTEEEARWVHEAESEDVKIKEFYRIWTGKESYGKATGQGVTKVLDTKGDRERGNYVTEYLEAPEGYAMAVTIQC